MRNRVSYILLILNIALFVIEGCERQALMDSIPQEANQDQVETQPLPPLDAWVNDGTNEPKVTGYAAGALTIVWPAIKDAVRYDVYTVSTYGPPISETKFADTTDTVISVASNIDKHMRIKAVDASDKVIDTWDILGERNIMLPYFVTGYFYDDFEDGFFNPAFYVKNDSQAVENGGYLQLNQNVTDNGPSIRIGYDPQGKRYMRVSVKWFQHRVNNYYYGGLYFLSYINNNDTVRLYNAHSIYSAYEMYGTVIDYENYEPHDFIPTNRPRSDLDPTEYFDTWFTREVIIDLWEGSFRVKVNGVEFATFDTPYVFNDKVGVLRFFRLVYRSLCADR